MAQSQFCLSWDAHTTNICTGLSALQQNGEFVDMTIAADGHHVKVHQVMMVLASPYIKDLISTAQCPHPVIFLNKISYKTLSAILEYIYTGEVQVAVDTLTEFIQAGKELHIKGLKDMVLNQTAANMIQNKRYEMDNTNETENNDSEMLEYSFFSEYDDEKYTIQETQSTDGTHDMEATQENENLDNSIEIHVEPSDRPEEDSVTVTATAVRKREQVHKNVAKKNVEPDMSVIQYTVSTQGSLQMILNRFLYYLKHTTLAGYRHWRCVDYLSTTRCPALVITKDDVVVQRASAHIHAFHDKKILKKVRNGSIFTAIHEAEREGSSKKEEKVKSSVTQDQVES